MMLSWGNIPFSGVVITMGFLTEESDQGMEKVSGLDSPYMTAIGPWRLFRSVQMTDVLDCFSEN